MTFFADNDSKKNNQNQLLIIILLLVLGIYLKTLAPDIFSSDSGELITVSYVEGVAHPSGSPLYCLLGAAFAKLPLGNIAWRINLLSVVGAFLCLWLTFYFLKTIFPQQVFWALAGIILLAGQSHFWQKAITTEVYSWQLFSTVAFLLLLLRRSATNKQTYLLALFFGGACALHITTLFLLPAVILYLFFTNQRYSLKQTVVCCFIFLVASALYVYLPLRAVKDPPLNWGNPQNISNLIHHILDMKDKETLYSNNLGWFWRQLKEFFVMQKNQYLIVGLIIGLIGLIDWMKTRRLLGVLFLLAILPYVVFYCLGEKTVKVNNFSVVFLLFLPFWVNGIKLLAEYLTRLYHPIKKLIPVFVCIYLMINLSWGFNVKNLRHFYLGYDYIDNMLLSLPENGILRTRRDNVTLGLMYFLKTKGRRSDLMVIGGGVFNKPITRNWSGAYSVGINKSAEEEAWGLLNYLQGEKPFMKRLVWSYFRLRKMNLTVDRSSEEIIAYYALYQGDYWRQHDNPESALDSYLEASKLSSHNFWMIKNLAWRFVKMGELELAEKAYRNFLTFRPREARVYANLGNIYKNLKMYEKSKASYRKALHFAPDTPLYQKNLESLEKTLSP